MTKHIVISAFTLSPFHNMGWLKDNHRRGSLSTQDYTVKIKNIDITRTCFPCKGYFVVQKFVIAYDYQLFTMQKFRDQIMKYDHIFLTRSEIYTAWFSWLYRRSLIWFLINQIWLLKW